MKKSIACFLSFVLMISMNFANGGAVVWASEITNLSDITYDEVGESVKLMPDIVLPDAGSYSNGYILIQPDKSLDYGQLDIEEDQTISTSDGAVSVVDGNIYLGDGESASTIGSINSTNDGVDGNDLQIDFSAALTNGEFEYDKDGDNIVGWTVNDDQVTLGDLAVYTQEQAYTGSTSNGDGTYTISGETSDGDTYTYASDVDYYNSYYTANKYEGIETEMNTEWTSMYTHDLVTESGYGEVLQLSSYGTILEPDSSNAYGTNFGPEAISDPFTANAGDSLSLDWKAQGGDDNYEIYGYLEKLDDANNETVTSRTLLMYGRGSTQDWTTATGVIPTDGTYQFHFISGTYDRSGGWAVGATLYVDNVKIFSGDVATSVAQEIARRVTYTLSGHEDPQTVNMDMTFVNESDESSSASVAVTIQGSSDANLSGLSVDRVTLSPAFDQDTSTYTATVGYETTTAAIIATTASNYARMKVGDATVESGATTSSALQIGENTFLINIESEDGSVTRTYTLIITRQDDTQAPVISGVEDGKYYADNRTVTISDDTSTSVTLDGQSFTSGTTITSEGEHRIEAVDAADNSTSLDFYIDKTAPIVSLSTSTSSSWTKALEVTASFSDSLGLDQVKLGDQSWTDVSGSTSTGALKVTIESNGTYTFSAKDMAGNQTNEILTVENVDARVPSISASLSEDDWTQEDVDITLNVDASTSGLKTLLMPDGTSTTSSPAIYTVSENGSYTFTATNNAGNSVTKTIVISNIDKTAPTAPTIESSESGDDYLVTLLSGQDQESGVAEVVYSLSGAESQEETQYSGSFTINTEGSTLVTAYTVDEVGNYSDATTESFTVSKSSSSSSGQSSTSKDTNYTVSGKTSYALVDDTKVKTTDESKTDSEGRMVTTKTLGTKSVTDQMDEEGQGAKVKVTFDAEDDIAITGLNGQLVKNMEDKESVLEINRGDVSYVIPAEQIDIDQVAKDLGETESLEDIDVKVSISFVTDEEKEAIESKMDALGYSMMAEPEIFTITATYDNKSVDVSTFNTYVDRTFEFDDSDDASKITTGVVIDEDENIHHIPTYVETKYGKTLVHVRSLHNSIYTLIFNKESFEDVKGNWSEDVVSDMASRLIVNGTSDTTFEPNRQMTRAEFAATLVRALGLEGEDIQASDFSDVADSDWYYNTVSIAEANGLIQGIGDQFEPKDTITRQEAMMMVARAYGLIESDTDLSQEDTKDLENNYADANEISDWAKTSVALCVDKGIVIGDENSMVRPSDEVTRAESATMIYRLLEETGLIN